LKTLIRQCQYHGIDALFDFGIANFYTTPEQIEEVFIAASLSSLAVRTIAMWP
jgi:hypothetical protein